MAEKEPIEEFEFIISPAKWTPELSRWAEDHEKHVMEEEPELKLPDQEVLDKMYPRLQDLTQRIATQQPQETDLFISKDMADDLSNLHPLSRKRQDPLSQVPSMITKDN